MTTRSRTRSGLAGLLAVLFLAVGISRAEAATFKVLVDSPTAFRAAFTGIDTDAADTLGNGSGGDFQTIVFDYWTVLVNLRGDSVTGGNLNGFYEIQLKHSGSVLANPNAPLIKVSLFFTGLAPAAVLTDDKSNSGDHLNPVDPFFTTTDTLTTNVDITYDDLDNTAHYAGAIAGDADLDNDGVPDQGDKGANDDLVKILNGIKQNGGMTGQQHGEAISTSRPRPGQQKKIEG